MRICDRGGIHSIAHIHSGKFDRFCKGLAGRSVKRALGTETRKTVVLETRWLRNLKPWIPNDTLVIMNPCKPIALRKRHHQPSEPLKLLMLARSDWIKGHSFALGVLESLRSKGIACTLKVTGWDERQGIPSKHEEVALLGWVSDERKAELIRESDFLLLPSLFEGSSMSVIESIVNGLPCICSPASHETIGIPSLIVDLSDPGQWADRIFELSIPTNYGEIVKKIEGVSNRFSIEVAREKWGDAYNELISSH